MKDSREQSEFIVGELKKRYIISLENERKLEDLYFWLFEAKGEWARDVQLNAITAVLIQCQSLYVPDIPPYDLLKERINPFRAFSLYPFNTKSEQ